MNKKNKKLLAYGLIALFIIVLIFSINGFKLPFAIFGEGLTINSMSTNTVISEDTYLRGVWWLINAKSNGGQSIVGTITPEESKTLTGYETEYPLTIEASALDEKVEYLLKNTGEGVTNYIYDIKYSNGWDGTACKVIPLVNYNDAPSCSSTDYNILLYQKGFLSKTYVCVRICVVKDQEGVLATIEPSSVKDELDMTLTARGERITKRISQDNPNVDFNSPTLGLIATAQYPSSGWTGNFPPSATDKRGFYDLSQSKWKITSTTRVNQYKEQLSNTQSFLRTQEISDIEIGCSTCFYKTGNDWVNDVKSKINSLNNVISYMKTDDMSLSQNAVWGNRADVNNGKVIVTLDRQLAVADLILKVRADWLGIKINVGRPQIVNSNCAEFKSGDNGKIDVMVKNIGTATGSFIASINCGTIKQSYTTSAISISPGYTKTISIPIDAGTFSGEKIDNCKIRVQDFNKASNYDESSVNCKILKPATCVEGEFYTENNCIKKCVDGTKKQLKCCNEGEVIDYDETKRLDEFGGHYCRETGGDNETINTCLSCEDFALSKLVGFAWKSKQCKPKLLALPPQTTVTCMFSFIKLFLIPISFIFVLLFGADGLSKLKVIKKQKLVVWIIALILALITAYFVYTLFGVGIIIGIGLLILSFIFKSIKPF